MNLQGRLINAISTAKLRNGWDVVEISQKHEGGDGLVPYGVVRFRRPTHGQPDERRFGTAEWVVLEDTIAFQNGHYDLTEIDSIEDYQGRQA
jgi:hypothetical protein